VKILELKGRMPSYCVFQRNKFIFDKSSEPLFWGGGAKISRSGFNITLLSVLDTLDSSIQDWHFVSKSHCKIQVSAPITIFPKSVRCSNHLTNSVSKFLFSFFFWGGGGGG